MDNIYAVVVTYNRKDILTKCIDAILTQTHPVSKLVIIDNNSTDGTEKYLKKEGYIGSEPVKDNTDKIVYKKLPQNIGGAGGFHEGMKAAREEDADWIWIMDDDVIPEKNCLEELVAARGRINEDVSFLASSIRGTNGEAMNVPKITRKQFMHYTDWYKYLDSGIVQIVKATFVSLLINGKAVKKCGLPWKEFFIWGDDSEYTQRIIRDYGPAYMVGKSKALHLRASANELSLVKETDVKRIPMYFYYYRNNLIVFREYETVLYRFLCFGKLGWDFFMVIFKGRYKGKKLGVIIKAYFNYITGAYGRKSFRNRAKE